MYFTNYLPFAVFLQELYMFILVRGLSKPFIPFALGALSTIVIPKLIRPILVGTVTTGLSIKEYAQSTWADGVAAATKIREEAIQSREKTLEREIHDLREELKDIKK